MDLLYDKEQDRCSRHLAELPKVCIYMGFHNKNATSVTDIQRVSLRQTVLTAEKMRCNDTIPGLKSVLGQSV